MILMSYALIVMQWFVKEQFGAKTLFGVCYVNRCGYVESVL